MHVQIVLVTKANENEQRAEAHKQQTEGWDFEKGLDHGKAWRTAPPPRDEVAEKYPNDPAEKFAAEFPWDEYGFPSM